MPTPDLTSPALFPAFSALPLTTPSPSPSPSQPEPTEAPREDKRQEWYLLAQIKEDMTLTKPTLILSDVQSNSFALVFDMPQDALNLSALGLKKGATVVIPRATKTLPPDGEGGKKQGFVRLGMDQVSSVRAIPAGLERTVQVARWLRERESETEKEGEERGGGGETGCESCGRQFGGQGEGLVKGMRCTGCGEVKYCSKECQVRGWNEGGHKGDCKIIKAIRSIWP